MIHNYLNFVSQYKQIEKQISLEHYTDSLIIK